MEQRSENSGKVPRIGEIYFMFFDGHESEQSGWRPALIFQNNVGNIHSPNVIVLPLTSAVKKQEMPTHVLLKAADTGLKFDSMVLCENPVCVSKSKLGRYLCRLSPADMRRIAIASMIATSAIAFVDVASLSSVRERALKLNNSS